MYNVYCIYIYHTREVNPYKKNGYFLQAFFCVQSSIKVSITFFLFPTNILSNKVKQVCYKIIFINSLFIIYYNFFKIFIIVGNLKKKCGHREKSCELKQLLFLRVYLSGIAVRSTTSTPWRAGRTARSWASRTRIEVNRNGRRTRQRSSICD